MARWTLCWLLLISIATAGAYLGTNEFVARQQDEGYAMRLLGAQLGSPTCSQAARDLVAAGDGAVPTASPELQATYDRAGLVNTYPALILPFAAGPFGVFLMRQFMLGLPDELLEAARIGGASEFRIFFQVVLPIIFAPLATLGILTFLASWNNLLWPLVVSSSEQMYTLPVAVATFAIGQNATDYGLLMAGSTILVFPVLVVFLALQRYFQPGIATTGLKG